MREAASLLIASGHQEAYSYHIGLLWYEASLVRRRIREQVRTDSIALHTVIATVMSGKNQHLQKFLKELSDGD